MDRFHSDILKLIFRYLSPGTKVIARFVCSRWRLVIPVRKIRPAIYSNNLKLMKWAHSQGAPWDVTLDITLASQGRVDICSWAMDHGLKWTMIATNTAIEEGHLPLLREIHRRNLPIHQGSGIYRAIPNHLEMIRWYGENVIPGHNWNVYYNSFPMDDPKVIPFLDCMAAHGITYNLDEMMTSNIRRGNYHILEWLQKRHPAWTRCQKTIYLSNALDDQMGNWVLSQHTQ